MVRASACCSVLARVHVQALIQQDYKGQARISEHKGQARISGYLENWIFESPNIWVFRTSGIQANPVNLGLTLVGLTLVGMSGFRTTRNPVNLGLTLVGLTLLILLISLAVHNTIWSLIDARGAPHSKVPGEL